MNLNRVYDAIVSNAIAQDRAKGCGVYYEQHHIIPRSMGGSNDTTNLVLLTGREHFICHVILSKLYPNHNIAHAAFKMACVNDGRYGKITSRLYESLRVIHAHRVSTDVEARKKKSIAGKGKKQTAEHIAARTASRKDNGNEWHSDDTLQKISVSRMGQPGYWKDKNLPVESIEKRKQTMRDTGGWEWDAERRQAQSDRLRGQPSKKAPLTDEQKQKLREEKSRKVVCPHCGKEGSVMIMPRWHFDNCKLLSNK